MTINQTEIDGVPVFWVDGPPPLTAQLIFRSGVRDETFVTTGLTHLVEHLVMSGISPHHHDSNASVDPSYTTFMASGRPDSIASFISGVCGALSSPNLNRLEVEKKILAAEASVVIDPTVTEHLRSRYGLKTLGLTDVAPPALAGISADEVRLRIQDHFTAGNAALALSGPPPEGLRIPLPSGARRSPDKPVPVSLPLPMWFEQSGPHLGLSFAIPMATEELRENALTLGWIICERARVQLRQEKGWIYDVDFYPFFGADGAGLMCLVADPPPAHVEDVRLGMLRILDDLRRNCPSDEELAHMTADLREYLSDPRNEMDAAVTAAESHLVGQGFVSPQRKLELAASLSSPSARAVLELMPETLIVGMPQGTYPDDDSLSAEDAREYPEFHGRTFRPGLRGAVLGVPRRARLIIGEEGMSFFSDRLVSVFWGDIVGMEISGAGQVTVIAADSLTIELNAAWFSKGNEAVRLITDRVDERLQFEPAPELKREFG